MPPTLEKIILPFDTEEEEKKDEERLNLKALIEAQTANTLLGAVSTPPSPGLYESFIHGLTLHRVGEAPDTIGGYVANLTGELAGIVALSILADTGFGALGIGGGLLGTIGREALVGGVVSAITPEKDPYLPIVFGALGGAGNLLGRVLRGAPKEVIKEVATTIPAKQDVKHIFDLLVKPSELEKTISKVPISTIGIKPEEATTLRTALEEDITKFSTLAERLNSLEFEAREKVSQEVKNFIFSKYKEPELLNIGIKTVKKDLLDTLRSFNRPLTPEELDVFEKRIIETPFMDKQALKNQIDRYFLGKQFKTTADKSRINFDEVLQVADKFNRKLTRYEQAYQVGLLPKSPIFEVEKKATQVMKKIEDLETQLIRENPEYKNLLKEADLTLDSIYRNRLTGITPEFTKAKEYLTFVENVAKFISPAETNLRAERALEVLRDSTKVANDVLKAITKDAEKFFKPGRKDVGTAVGEVLNNIDLGKIPPPKQLAKLREPLFNYIRDRISTLDTYLLPEDIIAQRRQIWNKLILGLESPAEKDTMEEIIQIKKAMVESIVQDLPQVERIAQATGDRFFEKAVLLYRASLGDRGSMSILQTLNKTDDFSHDEDMLFRRFLLSPEVAPEEATPFTTVTKTDLIIPPDKPSASTPSGTPPPGGLGSEGGAPPGTPPSGTSPTKPMINPKDPEALAGVAEDIKKDISGFARAIRSPIGYFRGLAEKAKTPEYKEMFSTLAKYFEDVEDARIEIRRANQEGLTPLLSRFEKMIFQDNPPDVAKAGLELIDQVSKKANELLDSGLSREAVEKEIEDLVSKQAENVQSIYRAFRGIGDWILEYTNKAITRYNELIDLGKLRGKKLPLIERRPGWVPFLYEGDYFVYLKDSGGTRAKTIIKLEEAMDSDSQLRSFIKDFLTKNPDWEGTIVLEPRFLTATEDATMLASLLKDADQLFGVTSKEIKRLMTEGKFTPKNVKDVFFGSLLPREWNLESRRIDSLKALVMNGVSAIRFANYLVPVRQGINLIDTLKSFNLPKTADYLQTYINHLLGRSGKVEALLDDILQGAMKHIFKVPLANKVLNSFGIREDGRIVRNVLTGLNFLNRMVILGFNPSSPLINTALFITNVLPVVGIKHAKWALSHLPYVYGKGTPQPIRELLREAGLDLIVGGLGGSESLLTPSVVASRPLRFAKKLDSWSMWLWNQSEKVTRGASLLAGYRQGEELAMKLAKGKVPKSWQEKLLVDSAKKHGVEVTNPTALKEYAKRITRITNFTYDASDLPELLRATPLKSFTQFKTFMLKEYEFLLGLKKDNPTEFLLSLGLIAGLGGMLALPGMQELDGLSRLLFGFSPKEWAYSNMPEVFAAGLPALFGIDLSSRLNPGDVSYLFNLDLASLGGAFPTKLKDAISLMFREGKEDQALRMLSPSALRTLMDSYSILTGKGIQDPYSGGITIPVQPKNPVQLLMRLLGFPTYEEARFRAMKAAARTIVERARKEKRNALEDYFSAIESGDIEEASRIKQEAGLTSKDIKTYKALRSRSPEKYIKDILPKSKETSLDYQHLFEEED